MVDINESGVRTGSYSMHEQSPKATPGFESNDEKNCGHSASFFKFDSSSLEIGPELIDITTGCDRTEMMSPPSTQDINSPKCPSLLTAPSIAFLKYAADLVAIDDDVMDPVSAAATTSINLPPVPGIEAGPLELQLSDIVGESRRSSKTSYSKGFCPSCSRPEVTLSYTLNQPAIALAVCVDRSLSRILHRLDWTISSIRICCGCYGKASNALKIARGINSGFIPFSPPPPKGRKQAPIHIYWTLTSSDSPISKALVSFAYIVDS